MCWSILLKPVGSLFLAISSIAWPEMFVWVIGALALIWLGQYCLRNHRAIASITSQLTDGQQIKLKAAGTASVRKLIEAVNKNFDSSSGGTAELEQQNKELQVQYQLAQRQKRNAEAIIYSIRDAVIVTDEFDKLLMANESAAKLFKFDFETCRHKTISEVMDSDTSGFVDFLRRSRQSQVQATRREIKLFTDDTARTFDCIVSCVCDRNGQVCGVVAVLHDITREKEISQMKNDFVSHVSHELKTPLSSITAYSEMLLDGEAEDENTKKEFYTVIHNQAKRLNRMIEDILNVSRIESGLIKLNKGNVSLALLAQEQMKMIKSKADEKDIELIGQKPIVYDQVYADKEMIEQVVVNLLSNAVKYTKRGGSVRLDIEVDEINSVARVSVTDTGVGIPEEDIEHVFDKFYRVEANKKQAKGTGLGLNLVKKIIENIHGGRVFVRSKVASGSTFGFELPLSGSKVAKTV